MPVYVVGQGRIENRKLLDEYVAKVVPTISSHGGRIVAFDESPEVVEGAPWLFWRNLGIVAWESPIRCFLTPALFVIVSALVIALYERSRCVNVATLPAPDRQQEPAIP